MKLRFLTVATSSQTFISDEIRGTARLPDGRAIEFACSAERLGGSIVDVGYRELEEGAQQSLVVRCESQDMRRRDCPADTSGGVTLLRQLSRTPCQQGVNWGYGERGIWVDRGCRADFQIVTAAAAETLELVADGWGFLRQGGDQAAWLEHAELSCEADGAARLEFSGQQRFTLSGICYRLDENRIELELGGGAAADVEGGGSAHLIDDKLSILEVAGRARFGQPFSISFRNDSALGSHSLEQRGEGLLELADGRRAVISGVRIEPASSGQVTLVFDSRPAFGFRGAFFPAWSGTYEVILDEGLNDPSTRGAGSIRWSANGKLRIDLVGKASSVGGAYRLEFRGEGALD